jgi:hypothetical protein
VGSRLVTLPAGSSGRGGISRQVDRVDPAAHLTHLRREVAAFAACLTGDLSAPVAACAP